MACASIVTELAPFCAPVNNTQVSAIDQVTITWDPTYFSSPDTMVQIQADFSPAPDTGITDPTPLADTGFTSDMMRADTGSYVWNVSGSRTALYSDASATVVDARLYMVVAAAAPPPPQANNTDDADAAVARTDGPVVRVVPGPAAAGANATAATPGQDELGDSGPDMSGGGLSLVAILVPLGLGLLALAALAAYLYRVRGRRARQQQQQARGTDASVAASWTLRGPLGTGRNGGGASEGYGMESRAVPMGDMSISRPWDGRNVFQEEIQRQEAERRI